MYFPERWDLRSLNGKLLLRHLLTVSPTSTSSYTLSYCTKDSESLEPMTRTSEFVTEGHFARFEAFLTRAATCSSIVSTSSESFGSHHSSKSRIILLEDLPNILHHETQTRFHQALISLVNSPPSEPPVPIVIIVSDAGMRGEDPGGRVAGWDRNQVVDGRTVIPRELFHTIYVTEIGYGLHPTSQTGHHC